MSEPRLERLTLAHLEDVLLVERMSFSDPWSAESYRRELGQNQLAHYYGCMLGRRLLGFGGFWQIMEEGHIANVAVHPHYRGQGIGQLLVARLVAACLALGGTAMTLEVRAGNQAAQRLYQKFGFKAAGLRPHYYRDQEDAVIMWADLTQKAEEQCRMQNAECRIKKSKAEFLEES